MSKPIKDKYAIAAALQEIGTLLELKGGEYFKARAYKLGARSIAEVTEDLGKLIKENRLTFVKGIGFALAKQIEQLYTTGESSMLNDLRGQMPPGIVELSNVRGLSLKKVEQLHEALGITTVEQLKAAAEAGKLREVKGFTAKTEQKILDAINASEEPSDRQRIHIHHALRAAERILEYLRTSRALIEAEIAGDLRRWQETVAEVVVVASARNPKSLVDHFVRFPMVVRTHEESPAHAVVRLSEGFNATFIAVKPEQFALTLLNATGSEAHLRKLDQIAARKKLAIWSTPADSQLSRADRALGRILHRASSSGAVKRSRTNKKSKAPSTLRSAAALQNEAAIYRQLGMQYVPPELREDLGEVEAAQRKQLPDDLITAEDIRGMVHCHTTYSDGKHSVEQMVAAAAAMGMKYITITDHRSEE